MQRRSNENCKCAQRFCLTIGVHPKSWVQFGSVKSRTAWKTVQDQVRRTKTNQRDSKLESTYEPEGRQVESLRAPHLNTLAVILLSELNKTFRWYVGSAEIRDWIFRMR